VISRDEAVGLLGQQHTAVAELLSELDEDALARRGTMGGSGWSAKDLAAHIGSWEEFSLQTIEAFGRGERPAIEDALGGDRATDRVNEQQQRQFLDADRNDVMARFEDLHRRLVDAIRSTGDEQWASDYPYDPDDDTLGERLGSLLGSDDGAFMHASAHLPDLRAYVDSISR
jgi:Mycothiol maleylpyruvate isomerase N-terminal domain